MSNHWLWGNTVISSPVTDCMMVLLPVGKTLGLSRLMCFMDFYLFIFLFRAAPVPKLRVELELPAFITTTATGDLSHICNLYHSSMLDP